MQEWQDRRSRTDGHLVLVRSRRATDGHSGARIGACTPLSGAMDVFVAALNGSALGIGSELALACDYRLMAAGEHVIGQPEILLGFPPGGGGTQRLVRLLGPHQGLKIMLEGASLDPEAAEHIGYVDEVVAPDELVERALAHADRLAQRVKPAVAAVKHSVYIGGSRSLEEGLHLERAEFLTSLARPGAQTAMLAYLDQTAKTGDLPLYDAQTYAQARDAGRFEGATTMVTGPGTTA